MKNEILIYDVIGQDFFGAGVTAKDVKEQLDNFGDVSDITVRVNSPGGDVFEGLAIYNLLNEHPAKVTVKVDGFAASIASVIALAGTVEMAANSMFMIHNPYTFCVGDSAELTKQAEILDKVRDSLVITYEAKTNVNATELTKLMDAETWFSASEALDYGFADSVNDDVNKLANVSSFEWINKAPTIELEPAPQPERFAALERSIAIDSARAQISAARKTLK